MYRLIKFRNRKYLYIVFFLIVAEITSCRFVRMAFIQMPGQYDFAWHTTRPVSKGDKPVFHFIETSASTQKKIAEMHIPDSKNLQDSMVFEKLLKRNHVASFLLIHKDSILYEKYFGTYAQERYFTSFSVAKSYVVSLLGIAIHEGFIKSIQDPAYLYVPEIKGKKHADSLKVIDLLEHRSGIRFREIPFNPFGRMTALYHRRNQVGILKHLRWDYLPGTRYEYQDVNSYLLGLIIERATSKSLEQYFSEKIWSRLGMEADATWSIDKKGGHIRPFCCVQSTSRDMARYGRLYLKKGNWEGEEIIPSHWIERATYCDDISDDAIRPARPWHWQTGGYPDCDFNARGLYDQFIYVHPRKEVVIVMISDKHYFTRIAWRELFRRIVRDYL